MFRVLTCLAFEHNWWLVVLAGVVCLLASVTVINLLHRARGTKGRARSAWTVATAAAAGCGIWATHFIAMLAYDPGIALGYDIPLTALSLAAAIVITGIGLSTAVYSGQWIGAATGGAIVGAGVASMHYTGMSAIQLPGHLSWHLDLVITSVLLGMILGATSLLVARISPRRGWTATAAALLTLAIVSHHFTAMGAVQIVPDPSRVIAQFTMSSSVLAISVASAAFALLALSFASAFTDRRLKERDLQLITAINNMPQGLTMFDASERLIVCNTRYLDMYGLAADAVRPNCSLRDVIASRIKVGSLNQDPEQYRATLLDGIKQGKPMSWIVENAEGHAVAVTVSAMQEGCWIATHEDITERRKAEARIAKEVDENRRLFDTSLDLILVTDRSGNFVRVSPISVTILGYAPEEMIGSSAVEFIYPDDLDAIRNEMRLTRRGRDMRNFEARYVHKQGHVVTLAWSGVWSEPEQKYFFTGRDVTESKLVEEKLKYLAHYDQLTALPNRTSLQNDLDQLMSSCGGSGRREISIAIFDLDGFKDVNDTLGHSTGDKLLQEVARRMSALAVEHARFYRLGGDEFVLILPDCGDPREIAQLVDCVLSRMRASFDISGHQLFIGASAGIAIATDDLSTEELISHADLALYDAKAAGGNRYRLFLPVLRAKAQARRELGIELRRAYSNNEFFLCFQPQMRVTDHAVVGAEALLRWRHPQRGILAPGAFIEALAESPIALELGRWIMQTACKHAARWRSMGLPPIRIGVNLFPAQFHQGTLLKDVDVALLQSGLSPEALELEITENIALGRDDEVLAQLRALRSKGVNLAFDDFGTGYASLSYLARYPLTRIKIDQSFMRKITDKSTSQDTAIVRSLVVMAHNLGLQVIAEGVETPDQAAFLEAEKCEEAQGFLYAKPLAIEKFEEFLKLNQQLDRFRQIPDALAFLKCNASIF